MNPRPPLGALFALAARGWRAVSWEALTAAAPDTRPLSFEDTLGAVDAPKVFDFAAEGWIASSAWLECSQQVTVTVVSASSATFTLEAGVIWKMNNLAARSLTLSGIADGTDVRLWAQGKEQ